MKSIVLCERTLVQESEDFSDIKEEKINEEGNEKAEEKKFFNGTPNNEKQENCNEIFQKNEVTFKNDDKISPNPLFSEKVGDIDEKETLPLIRAAVKKSSENFLSGEAVETGKSNSRSDENCSVESKVLENLNAQNMSASVRSSISNEKMNFSSLSDDVSDDAIEIIDAEKSENSLVSSDNDSSEKNSKIDVIEEKELKNVESKKSMESLESIVLDLDENKENEKEETTNLLEEYSENDLLNKHSSECEIRVEEVQTISGLEKDSMWAENDLKKSEEASKENLDENLASDCQDISVSNEDDKNDSHELESDENIALETEESVEERMHIEVEEAEQTEDLKIDGRDKEQADFNSFSTNKNKRVREMKNNKTNYVKINNTVCRKRRMSGAGEGNSYPQKKKKKLSEDEERANQIQSKENAEGSSRCRSLASLDAAGFASKDGFSPEVKKLSTKKNLAGDKNPKKRKSSINSEGAKKKNHQTTGAMFSVLEKFRGTLKTLTRSDLEELIVQKLCEVITERSNVGELRQKAQALEQDQERWKAKAQSLTKQMREMEMVMRKYMSEVQKQIKEGDTHVVTPLKVTRSVGLQVSFFCTANKIGLRPNFQPSSPLGLPQNVNARNGKGPPSKLPSQFSSVIPNFRNKPMPAFQKSPTPLQKTSAGGQQRRQVLPKSDYSSNPSNRSAVVQHSLLNNNRGTANQAQLARPNYKATAGTSSQLQQQQQQPQQPHHHHQQQQQQQQQNGSKVIDLTEDDDRQTANTGTLVKTSAPVKVINHLTQPTASQNNRFAYLLPTTSLSTGSSVGTSRQVLIATPTVPQPNRQIMCSMPPLLFKGGSAAQPGSPPQMLNQSNKFILPKTLRHPAPLPQRPINQSTKRNLKLLPPRPALKISKVQTGIVLSWNMSLGPEYAPIASYQLYAYQESDSPPATSLWKKVGDVKALPLPMACTLTQFMSGHKYHFAVRAVDLHSRIGPFSYPGTIVLV